MSAADRLWVIEDYKAHGFHLDGQPATVEGMRARIDEYNAYEAAGEAAFMRRHPGVL